jgi:hypothetical protein
MQLDGNTSLHPFFVKETLLFMYPIFCIVIAIVLGVLLRAKSKVVLINVVIFYSAPAAL